jgi:glycosyltransferase involved in cell wall biosynthesis
MSLPNLLMVTPSLPSPVGTGSMMRAAMSLEALRKRFRVHVLNLNVWSWNLGRPSFVLNRAASYAEVPGTKGDVDGATLLDKFFPGVPFAAIHTFKLVTARVTVGMLAGIKGPRPRLVLDLDDDECARSETLLKLLEEGEDSDPGALSRARADQTRLRMLEKMLAPRFDALCLAGLEDCRALQTRYPHIPVHHLPNAIDLPENFGEDAPRRDTSARLLFVGALYYAPNADGIRWFCERVLPVLQEMSGTPVSLQVVGADPLRSVERLASNPAVAIHANVPSVAPFYHETDLCIVPLRAGSGTRIKILEAFSFRRAVVSTRLGAEGLAVTDGEQLLLADDPDAMARACFTLLNDHTRRDRMAASAWQWVLENHSIANVEAAMDSIYMDTIYRCPL